MIKKIGGVIINPFCSLACLFCGSKKKVTEKELKEQEFKIYKNLQDFKKEGIKEIEISGADPLEYEKIIELLRYMRKSGFEIQLSTNGVKLSEPYLLNRMSSLGISFRIPIYGSNAKVHDSVTQTSGSFDRTVVGIKNLLKKNPKTKIQVSSLIMKQNKDDLLNIVDFIDGLGVKNFYFSIPFIAQNEEKFYVPLKDIGPYLRRLYRYALKINDEIQFLEIPFCIFGELNFKNINNMCYPPNLGKYNQPPENFRTSTPDLPSYRVKKKIGICNNCKAFNYCDGFLVNDIDKFGTGKIKKL